MKNLILAVTVAGMVLSSSLSFATELTKYSVLISSSDGERFTCNVNVEVPNGHRWIGTRTGDDDVCISVFENMGKLFSLSSSETKEASIEFKGIRDADIGYISNYLSQTGWKATWENGRKYHLTRKK